MITRLRFQVGGTSLVASFWILSGAIAAPPLSKDSYKKAAEADIAQLQKYLAICDSEPSKAKRTSPTARSLATMLAMYGEALGDKVLQDQALKVADAVSAKNYKNAIEAAKSLAAKPGNNSLTDSNLVKIGNYSLEEVMSPFRGGKVGGLNIEADLRAIRDGKKAFNAAEVEIMAARVAVLLDYANHKPNEWAMSNKEQAKDWNKLNEDSIELCKKLSDEAAKGSEADQKEIVKHIKLLDAKCVNCHSICVIRE